VERSDLARRDYLRRAYYVDWNTIELYDLVINTRRLSVTAATDLIIQTLGQRDASNAPPGKDAHS
jgi:cytidylate kinase